MTPFVATTSAVVTFASSTFTPELVSINTGDPETVLKTCSSFRSFDATAAPATTWYVKISVSAALLSPARTPGLAVSKAANAASVGANTVNGPGPFRTSIKPALVNAAASFVKLPAATAVSTMSLSSLSAPPVPPAPAAAPAAPAPAPAAPPAAAPPLDPPPFPAEATLPALPPSASLSLPQPATDKLANSITDSQGKY